MLLYSLYFNYPFRVDVTPNKFQDFGSAQARWIVIVCFQKFHNKGEEATRAPKPPPSPLLGYFPIKCVTREGAIRAASSAAFLESFNRRFHVNSRKIV